MELERKSHKQEARMATIGEQIRARRSELGLTQQQLADASGIERYNIGKIEIGARDVSATEVAFLADALNVAPAALLPQATDGLMFRHRRPESDGAKRAIAWFEQYVAESARLRAISSELNGHRG
jgi:transcriptional regulator with XRE-family HTH domain